MPNVLISNAKTISDKDCLSIEIQTNGILYDELEKANIILPHGCLSGSCGACCIEILEGMENLSKPSTIEENTLSDLRRDKNIENIRLACRAKVLNDVVIKILK